MKNVVLLAISLVLFGCGGDFTTTMFTPQDGPDGTPLETGGAPGTGGKAASGGAPTTGGAAATGGAPEVDSGPMGSGGAPLTTGGAPSTGGVVVATGGVPTVVDAGCMLVTHDNGLGQTWEDCVPLGTYNEAQAMKACEASEAVSCTASLGCGGGNVVIGRGDPTDIIVGAWGYGGNIDSHVCGGPTCSGCPSSGSWN